MISQDLANMADRMLGHNLHETAPTPDECGTMAAELLKFSRIVEAMESLPLDFTLQQLTMPQWK